MFHLHRAKHLKCLIPFTDGYITGPAFVTRTFHGKSEASIAESGIDSALHNTVTFLGQALLWSAKTPK